MQITVYPFYVILGAVHGCSLYIYLTVNCIFCYVCFPYTKIIISKYIYLITYTTGLEQNVVYLCTGGQQIIPLGIGTKHNEVSEKVRRKQSSLPWIQRIQTVSVN